jgi:hypothetical protein
MYYCKTRNQTCSLFNPADNHARKASLGVLSSIFTPLEWFISEHNISISSHVFVLPADNDTSFYWHSFIFHSFTTN